MPTRRGDVVTVAAAGDYGKPRPAVIVQTDAFSETRASVVICQMTSELAAADFRITIEPGPETGLRARSQVMADKPVTIRRERIGERIGRLGAADMARLNVALAFVMGLADRRKRPICGCAATAARTRRSGSLGWTVPCCHLT
jgi:mRNA interferase MazF